MFKNFSGFFVRKNDDGGKKKGFSFENLIVIVILGVIVIIAASSLTKPNEARKTLSESSSLSSEGQALGNNEAPMSGQEIIADIEKRLSNLLSQVEGAGKVEVMVFADTSAEQVPAYNNKQDTSNDERNGGKSSEISETRELALSGNDSPVILKVIVPQIKGVVVVAEGANDMLIKAQLNNAVCTLLGIPEHRVQILKHK